MKNFLTVLATTAFVALGASNANAQTSQTMNVSMTINEVLRVVVDNSSVSFGSPTASDYIAGYKSATTSTAISHFGNIAYNLQVAATSATMGTTTKPSSDLEYQAVSGSKSLTTQFTPISTTPTSVFANFTPGKYDNDVTVNYRMKLNPTDAPGTYNVGFVYTVIAVN